jgi:hypothetical protein
MSERVTNIRDIQTVPFPDTHRNGDSPESPSHTWQPANLLTLAAAPPAPPTIGGLLYPGKRTVLSGETESMKTWLALILCKAELDIGLPVAWIDLDAMGPGALLDRLRLLGVQDQRIADDFLYYEPDRPLDDRHTEPIAELLEQRQIRLCVIDAFNPILGMHALDPNATTDVEKFWQLYRRPDLPTPAPPPSSSTTSSRTPKPAANTPTDPNGKRPGRSSTSGSSSSSRSRRAAAAERS